MYKKVQNHFCKNMFLHFFANLYFFVILVCDLQNYKKYDFAKKCKNISLQKCFVLFRKFYKQNKKTHIKIKEQNQKSCKILLQKYVLQLFCDLFLSFCENIHLLLN